MKVLESISLDAEIIILFMLKKQNPHPVQWTTHYEYIRGKKQPVSHTHTPLSVNSAFCR